MLTLRATGRGFKLTYESPKNEGLALFELGERAFDHLLILPSKSRGIDTYQLNAHEADL